MKKLTLSALALAIATLASAPSFAAEPGGTIEASYGHAVISNDFGDADTLTVNGRFTETKDTTFTGGLVALKSFHQHGAGISGGVVQNLNDMVYVTGNLFVSDNTLILPQYRVTAQANFKVGKGMILGVGGDHIVMRGGSNKNDALLLSAVYYVQSMPLILQGDVRLDNATPGDHKGERYGIAATYGTAGDWTLTGRADSGISGYESTVVPGQLVRFPVKHQGLSYSKWLAKDYGVVVAADNVTNQYYTRREARVGAFFNF